MKFIRELLENEQSWEEGDYTVSWYEYETLRKKYKCIYSEPLQDFVFLADVPATISKTQWIELCKIAGEDNDYAEAYWDHYEGTDFRTPPTKRPVDITVMNFITWIDSNRQDDFVEDQ